MSTHSVYSLCDPRTGDIRYIGQAEDIYKRYAQHLIYGANNKVKWEWLMELKMLDLLPVLIIVEKGIKRSEIRARENYWITYYLERGDDLTNIVLPAQPKTKREKVKKAPVPRKENTADQECYTIRELIDGLSITLAELGRRANLNEVTVARIRDGERARRGTANSLLRAMSQIYGRDLTLANVTGINVQGGQSTSATEDDAYPPAA